MVEKTAEPVDDRQPKAETATAVFFGRGELINLAENVLPLILGDADPAVPDFDAQEAGAAAAADHDAAMDSVAHRVRHQIEEDPFEQNEIAANPGTVRDDP